MRAGPRGARVLLLGGAAMDGPRHLFWNFVSSSRERIEQAKADWKAGRFGKVPGDEREFIPLPERVAVRAVESAVGARAGQRGFAHELVGDTTPGEPRAPPQQAGLRTGDRRSLGGLYALRRVCPVDMFPQTAEIEVATFLEKA